MQETMTMEQAEDQRRARIASAWTMFAAGVFGDQPERAPLRVVDGPVRVGRRRRARRATRTEVAA